MYLCFIVVKDDSFVILLHSHRKHGMNHNGGDSLTKLIMSLNSHSWEGRFQWPNCEIDEGWITRQ